MRKLSFEDKNRIILLGIVVLSIFEIALSIIILAAPHVLPGYNDAATTTTGHLVSSQYVTDLSKLSVVKPITNGQLFNSEIAPYGIIGGICLFLLIFAWVRLQRKATAGKAGDV